MIHRDDLVFETVTFAMTTATKTASDMGDGAVDDSDNINKNQHQHQQQQQQHRHHCNGDSSETTTTSIINININTNHLYLSNVNLRDYTREILRRKLWNMFANYGTVEEVFLSKLNGKYNNKEKESHDNAQQKQEPHPFGFVVMGTIEEAQFAYTDVKSPQFTHNLFQDVQPSCRQKDNAKRSMAQQQIRRKQQLQHMQQRQERIQILSKLNLNMIFHINKSHLTRFIQWLDNDLSLQQVGKETTNQQSNTVIIDTSKNNHDVQVEILGTININKDVSLLLVNTANAIQLRNQLVAASCINNSDNNTNNNNNKSDTSFKYWYLSSSIQRITLLDNTENVQIDNIDHDEIEDTDPCKKRRTNSDNVIVCDKQDRLPDYIVDGTIQKNVIPMIIQNIYMYQQSQQERVSKDDTISIQQSCMVLRIHLYPPKQFQKTKFIEKLECALSDPKTSMNVELSSSKDATLTISIIQIHSDHVNGNLENDLFKANDNSVVDDGDGLYVIGRIEPVVVQEENLSNHCMSDNQHSSNENGIDRARETKSKNRNTISISRAYWKLHEAFDRYRYDLPTFTSESIHTIHALDCGASPGGWTKFLYTYLRDNVSLSMTTSTSPAFKIYAIDPGHLSEEVLRLDPNSIRHIPKTIQQAMPVLLQELQMGVGSSSFIKSTRPIIDIWVSDMNVKDMPTQIECFLQARSIGLIGQGTFFVLTLKCTKGHSETTYDHLVQEQVHERLQPICQNIQLLHLFLNRSSERTVIGYL